MCSAYEKSFTRHHQVRRYTTVRSVLRFEFDQISRIHLVHIGSLILLHFRMVALLRREGLGLVRFLFLRRQNLPALPHPFRNLRKREILWFEQFSYFYGLTSIRGWLQTELVPGPTVGEYDVC